MIQRIQTVYLFIVCVLSLVCLCTDIGAYYANGAEVADFSNFTFNTYANFSAFHSSGPWALGILLIVVVFLSVMSIMLYRMRMRQLRLTIISSILLFGYILVYAFFAYIYSQKLVSIGIQPEEVIIFKPLATACAPLISLILNILAIHGIRKDEALVRSLDRIR